MKTMLKAGSQTGSLVNMIMSGSKDQKPEFGMGATVLSWTDRHAHTIVEILSDREIATIQDESKRTDSNGMSESQEYEYRPRLNGAKEYWTLRKNNAWVRKGEPLKGGQRITIGFRETYYDYSF